MDKNNETNSEAALRWIRINNAACRVAEFKGIGRRQQIGCTAGKGPVENEKLTEFLIF